MRLLNRDTDEKTGNVDEKKSECHEIREFQHLKFGALSYIRRISLFLGLIQSLKLSETAQCRAVLCLMTPSFSIFRVSEFCFDFQDWLDLLEQLKKCAKFKYFNSMPNFLWHSDFFSSLSPIFSSV